MGKRKFIGFAAALLVLLVVTAWRWHGRFMIDGEPALLALVLAAERLYRADFGTGPADLRWAQPHLDRLCQGAATISTVDGEVFVVQLRAGKLHQRVEFRRTQSENPYVYRYIWLGR